MGAPGEPGFDFEAAILARASVSGIELAPQTCRGLADHARLVLERNSELHLTTITDPAEFVERHLGESFEGASLLDARLSGVLLDLGSGNGYPAFPLAAARPGLSPILFEASTRRAGFLREAAEIEFLSPALIVESQVQRPADLGDVGTVSVLTARALGNWERLLPRLAPALDADTRVLLWAGETVETIARRVVWRRLRLLDRHPLPGRERSWIWIFKPAR